MGTRIHGNHTIKKTGLQAFQAISLPDKRNELVFPLSPCIIRLPAVPSFVTTEISMNILNVTESSIFETKSRPVYLLRFVPKLENPVWFFPKFDLFLACNLPLRTCNILRKQEISSMESVSVRIRSILICFPANMSILIASIGRFCPSEIVRTKIITKV